MYSYSPVVRAKANDLRALSSLIRDASGSTKPLVEASTSIIDKHLVIESLDAIASLLKNPPSGDFYFDALGDTAAISQVEAFAQIAAFFGGRMTPTLALGRGKLDIASLRHQTHRVGSGICVRLDLADIESGEETWQELIELVANIGIAANELDLIFDFRSLKNASIDALKEELVDFLAAKSLQFEPGELVLLGSSALESVGEIAKDDLTLIQRRELYLWANTQYEIGPSRNLRFGDYGIVAPDFVFGGPNPNANAKIRYTFGPQVAYFRGHGLLRPNRFPQYHDLARVVAESEFFMGRHFSLGDEGIFQCATHECGPGNLGTWVFNDMSHHMQIVAEQQVALTAKIAATRSAKNVAKVLESLNPF